MSRAGRRSRLAARVTAAFRVLAAIGRRPVVSGRLGRAPGAGGAVAEGPAPLDPRAESLLDLGREGAFLDAVTAPGRPLDVRAVGDRLVAIGALATAAALVQRCPPSLAGVNSLRAAVQDAAGDVLKTVALRADPSAYADAALALRRLQPDAAARAQPAERAAAHLIVLAGKSALKGDVEVALAALTRAARLRPDDTALLARLAEAAKRAGDEWRREETLRRLRDLESDAGHLTAGIAEALAAERWTALAALLDRARTDGPAREAARAVIEARSPASNARFVQLAGEGDWPGALGLAGALTGWVAPPPWPADAVGALIATARRRLRDPRTLADPAVWPVPEFILRIAPDDVDMGRLVGRNALRQRRLLEAVRRLGHVVEIDPHAAGDWLDLASAHDRLGRERDRDACLARAVAIDPASLPAPVAEAFWTRMAAA